MSRLHDGEDDRPAKGDGGDVGHAQVARHKGKVDQLGGDPHAPQRLERVPDLGAVLVDCAAGRGAGRGGGTGVSSEQKGGACRLYRAQRARQGGREGGVSGGEWGFWGGTGAVCLFYMSGRTEGGLYCPLFAGATPFVSVPQARAWA